jgi:hypothetical protein
VFLLVSFCVREFHWKTGFVVLFNNHSICRQFMSFGHWCTIGVPSFLANFEIIPIEAVTGQIYGGMGAGGQGVHC